MLNKIVNEIREEGQITLACLKELTDESLEQAVSEKDRTLGEIAWHVTQSLGGFADAAKVTFEGVRFDTPMPGDASEIAASYESTLNAVVDAYGTQLTDESVEEEVDFFGHPMKRSDLLTKFQLHQTHHRGQMTVLMRQAELRVPAIYGPSRDSE